MNKLELKALKLDALSSAYGAIISRMQWYAERKVDEDGNYIKDENDYYIYDLPKDEEELAKYKALESLANDFQNWALKY